VVAEHVDSLATEAIARATAGDCEGAREARREVEDLAPGARELRTPIARCLAGRSELGAAVRWAPDDPAIRAAGVARAEILEAEGSTALAAGDVEGAHRAWSEAIAADPLRPWLRRRIEQMRAKRLDLDAKRSRPPPESIDPTQRGG